MERTDRRSDCPINFALQTFGDAWSLLVIRDLMFTNRVTWTEFANAEERMASNVLADRLKALTDRGLIRRRGTGRRAAYGLTEKGLDLLPAMLELISWSARYDRVTAAPARLVAQIRKDRNKVAATLREQLRQRHGL